MAFLDRIAQTADRHGTRAAYACNGVTINYRDLFAIAHGIRDEVLRTGHGDAPRIGIVTSDAAETYASLLAVWSLGAAYVPLNAHNPPDRNAAIIQRAGLQTILTHRDPEEWPGHLPGFSGIVSTRDVVPNPAPLEFRKVAPTDLAYLFFTSGSTGFPKGVPISHANLSAFLTAVLTELPYRFSGDDRFLQMFELTFDLSVVSILAPWSVGGCCCVVPERGIGYMNILNVLDKEEITVALMVPSVLQYMRRFFGEVRFPKLRLSQFCGEALTQDIITEWSQCVPNAHIENVYGPTEATIFCTRYEWTRASGAAESVNGIVPIGRPMPGTRALIVDERQGACAAGVRGELCLAGDQVMAGYWNDRTKTAESFVTIVDHGEGVKAYRTGDLASRNENGNLVFLGRLDSQVKIDGHRVELAEVEYFARQFIGSSAAAAIVLKDSVGANRIRLFIAPDGADQLGLERFLRATLPAYMQPAVTTVLPGLPLNLNGKIDRPALEGMAAEQAFARMEKSG